jgi:hypothetical protein
VKDTDLSKFILWAFFFKKYIKATFWWTVYSIEVYF